MGGFLYVNPHEPLMLGLPQAGYISMTNSIVVQGHPAMGDILKSLSNRALCDVGNNATI
jgi:hypothetical protein